MTRDMDTYLAGISNTCPTCGAEAGHACTGSGVTHLDRLTLPPYPQLTEAAHAMLKRHGDIIAGASYVNPWATLAFGNGNEMQVAVRARLYALLALQAKGVKL